MRKYTSLYCVLAGIIIIGFLVFAITQRMVRQQEPDYVALNEIVKQAAQHWQAPDQLSGADFVYRFSIIDNDGIVLYASGDDLPCSIPAAIKRGFVPMDITVGSSVVGKALVETVTFDAAGEVQARLSTAIFIAFGLLAILSFGFLLAVHKSLIKPFERLQSFAHKITTGRLDEPLPMDKKNIFGLFTQSFDVMRESLLESERLRLQTERAKKELIASLSHDVKTPVTSIRLISELLRAESADPDTTEKLKTIETKADQIDRLMNDMLHSALEELGELKVTVVSEESSLLRSLFEDADHLSMVRVGEVPDCLLEFDRTRLEQVIGNIIANSYKYAGTSIDVDCAIEGGFFRVSVNDYGNGVGPEELELITTKFYRGSNANSSPKEGEGLGLYIAKLLMDKMGGGLEAFNRDDGFSIQLWLRLSR